MAKLKMDWVMSYYKNEGNHNASKTAMAYIDHFGNAGIDFHVFKRRIQDAIYRRNNKEKLLEEKTIDFKELSYANLSARKNDGTIMDIKEYCKFYNIDYDMIKSWKLVNHTDQAFYNIQSKDLSKIGIDIDLFRSKIIESIKSIKTLPDNIKRIPNSDDKYLLVVDPADIHIGKYSSALEVGKEDEYNSNIAVDRVYKGIQSLIRKASGYNIDKILFVMGNDVLHTDTVRRTTTGNTPQDTDGMWFENFLTAKSLYIDVLKMLLEVADVHVHFNPSNHDYMSGFMLSEVIATYFHRCDNITFDNTMAHRKYYKYGQNLIGTTHGDAGKERDLPLVMAHEAKEEWGNTLHKYIYTHHIHSKRSLDYQGVTVESMRSVSGADSWHHKNIYQHAPKTIECFLHHYDYGQEARFTHKF